MYFLNYTSFCCVHAHATLRFAAFRMAVSLLFISMIWSYLKSVFSLGKTKNISLINDWNNTYQFTKAIAEELARTASDLPLCVVRPPAVIPSYTEPSPGWSDLSCVFSSSGALLGGAIGFIHVMYVDKFIKNTVTPVDIVNNAIIAAGWASLVRRSNGDEDVPVYNVANEESYLTYDLSDKVIRNHCTGYPSPKAIWHGFNTLTKSKLLYWVLTLFYHYIPAYVLDAVFTVIPVKPKEIPSLVQIYTKIEKLSAKHSYLLFNEWCFKDDNVKIMVNRMSDADKVISYCMRKRSKLRVLHYIFMVLYVYVLSSILSIFWNIVKYAFFFQSCKYS